MNQKTTDFKCEICGKENVSLLHGVHKDFDRMIKMCQECWRDAYSKNRLVSGSGSSSSGCCG